MKLEIKNEENYAPRYVELSEFEVIPGADRIKLALINSNRVVVNAEAKAGDRGIFFPVESQINKEFLARNNQFSDKTLNFDQTQVSYFGDKGRVRCVKLRGAPSEGFLAPLSYLQEWKGIDVAAWDKIALNTAFDTINGFELSRKYYIRQHQAPGTRSGKKVRKQPSRMIEGVYKLHYDTPKLADNIHMLEPDDFIYITDKLHGCNISMGRVLVKRRLSIWEKIKKFFGGKVQLTEYDDIYASRTVIKNANPDKLGDGGFYKEDVWHQAFEATRGFFEDGMQIYGEIVGYTPNGAAIQKGYDYGCKLGENKLYVYRITTTAKDGTVEELLMHEVEEWCLHNKVNFVPVFYRGFARDLFPGLDPENHWHTEFLARLRKSFNMEQQCKLCKNKVPAEGIALRIEGKLHLPAYKFKSFKFLLRETEMLDKGEEDMESAEAVQEELVEV